MSSSPVGAARVDAPRIARGLWMDAAQRFKGNRIAVISGVLIALITLAAVIEPAVSPHDYHHPDWQHLASPPGWEASHWLGTDRLGRDLFVRALCGVRISLVIGLLATLVSLGVGVTWGTVAGYAGGRVDEWMMRVVDVLFSLPYLF